MVTKKGNESIFYLNLERIAGQHQINAVIHRHNASLGLHIEPCDAEYSEGCPVQNCNGSVGVVDPAGHGFLIAGNYWGIRD